MGSTPIGGSLTVTISTPPGPVQTVVRPPVTQEGAGLGVGSLPLADDVAKLHRRMVIAPTTTYRMSGWILARVVGNVFALLKTKRVPPVTTTASAPRTAARFATEKKERR